MRPPNRVTARGPKPRLAPANAFRRRQVGVPQPARRGRDPLADAGHAVSDGARAPAVLRRDTLYRRALAAADVLSAGAAVALAIVVLGDDALSPAVVVPISLVVLVAKTMGLYDRDE